MKIRDLVFFTGIMLVCMVATGAVVFNSLTGQSLFRFSSDQKAQTAVVSLDECSDREPIQELSQAGDAHLQKLGEYQSLCGSFVVDRWMVFTEMPKDNPGAIALAHDMSVLLKEFDAYSVTPVVIVEPVSEWGLIDFEEFKTGFYNDWLKTYFSELKQNGITDEQMGVWVPFPEANLPYWNHANATPEDFAAIVNGYAGILKTEFPNAHVSILLNSATYETDDFNWANGEYISLIQYVEDINPGLVDSFGLQGFPWVPPADRQGAGIYDAREFLNHDLATEAANTLGVTEIWFNTGTFRSKYTLDTANTVTITAAKRKDILALIISEAAATKREGYDVWVNIFAEDKSLTTEATDWSYLPTESSGNDHFAVLVESLRQLSSEGVGISIFDR